jgi:hypothetical protein
MVLWPMPHWLIILTFAIIAWGALSLVAAFLLGPMLKARSSAAPERDFHLLTASRRTPTQSRRAV